MAEVSAREAEVATQAYAELEQRSAAQAGRLEELQREWDAASTKYERRIVELERRVTEAREQAEASEAALREQARRVQELVQARDKATRRAEAAEAASERHELRARELEQAVEAASAAQAPQATQHLLFVQTGARYEVLERDGAPPVEGDEVELDEARFVVTKLGRSPYARDPRPCAYLQAAA
jgi:chromosome segregation ATPase